MDPTYGRAKTGRPARTYIQQLCEDTGCSPDDLPEAMNEREKWRESVRDIRAGSTTWWWWWWWWWCSLNIETVQVVQFNISKHLCSVWPIDRILSGATSPGPSRPGSNDNKEVFHILQSSSIIGAPPSNPGNSLVCAWGVLTLCRKAVGVFDSPSWQGNINEDGVGYVKIQTRMVLVDETS